MILILRLFLNYTEWGCHSMTCFAVRAYLRIDLINHWHSAVLCTWQFCSLCPMQQIVHKRNPSIREYAHTTIRFMGRHSEWRRHDVSWQLIEKLIDNKLIKNNWSKTIRQKSIFERIIYRKDNWLKKQLIEIRIDQKDNDNWLKGQLIEMKIDRNDNWSKRHVEWISLHNVEYV